MRKPIRFLRLRRASQKLEIENVPVSKRKPTRDETPAFTYGELDPDSNQIRLLRITSPITNSRKFRGKSSPKIHCELFHANLDDHPSYKALSYTWGDESDQRHTIYINGCQFEVRENLWHALNRFQSDKTMFVMWIDAICINQTSDKERNHQVNKMKMIYEQATQVIIWLGTSYEDSDLAFQLVHELYERRESTESITERFSQQDMLRMLRALSYLFYRKYWQRIWIVQELTVAVDIILYCGSYSMTAEHLHIVQQIFRKISKLDGFSHDLLLSVTHEDNWIQDNIVHHGIARFYDWKQDLSLMGLSFYECLLYHCGKEASDPRDMIYGLAALVNQTSSYKVDVDYGLSTKAAYTNFARLEIQTSHKLDIITSVFQGSNVHHLPSWVPDWSWKLKIPTQHIFLYYPGEPGYRFYSARQTKAEVCFDQDVMSFRGVIISTIDILGSPTNMLHYRDRENGIPAIYNWWETVARIEGASQNLHEAFARSLIWNQILAVHYCDTSKSAFLLDLLGCFAQLFKNANLDLTNNPVFSEHLSKFDKCAYKLIMYDWVKDVFQCIWDRRFFISNSETMGFAPREVVEGDIICVPLGCCHPIVLRRVEDHYINLGEAYVDGYMYGKAIDMWEAGELTLQEFQVW